MAKATQQRSEHTVTFAVAEEDHGKAAEAAPTLSALARQDLSHIRAADATLDEVRAKILQRHGSMANAFRQIDISGDSRICFEEFSHFLPKVLGEDISQTKLHILWGEMDTDLTGEIDLAEFSTNALSGHKATVQGVKILKDMAVDPTKGMLADHQKNKENYSGFGNEQPTLGRPPTKKLTRPESASTVATDNSPEPKTNADQIAA